MRLRRAPRGLVAATSLACSTLLACSTEPEGDAAEDLPGSAELRREVLEHLAESQLCPSLEAFSNDASALRGSLEALAAKPGEEASAAAEAAYFQALGSWQGLELLQLGPLASVERMGEDLRYEVYSWPLVNSCRVEQLLVQRTYEDLEALASQSVNARGLGALETLLFATGEENSCPPTANINAEGSWAALSTDELDDRRRAYALAVATLLETEARELVELYGGDDGFCRTIAMAGENDRYPSLRDAYNDWAAALFYLDTDTKDMKVAEVAGLMECATTRCVEEHPLSGASLDSIRQNLLSFRRQFFGGEPGGDEPGLDDLLRDVGEARVATDMEQRLDAALTAVDALDGTLTEALAEDRAGVEAMFDAIKAVTDLFKTDVFAILNLELPDSGASDTD